MSEQKLSVNILFPVLNERLRLESGIDRTMDYLKKNVKNPYKVESGGWVSPSVRGLS